MVFIWIVLEIVFIFFLKENEKCRGEKEISYPSFKSLLK